MRRLMSIDCDLNLVGHVFRIANDHHGVGIICWFPGSLKPCIGPHPCSSPMVCVPWNPPIFEPLCGKTVRCTDEEESPVRASSLGYCAVVYASIDQFQTKLPMFPLSLLCWIRMSENRKCGGSFVCDCFGLNAVDGKNLDRCFFTRWYDLYSVE